MPSSSRLMSVHYPGGGAVSDSKPKSLLAVAAEMAVTDGDYQPWWKDPKKIVTAALYADPDRRKALIAGLVNLATHNKKFRTELISSMRELGKGKRGNPGRPLWLDAWIFTHVNLLRETKRASSYEEAFEHASKFFSRSASSIKNIYYQSKRNPQINPSPNYPK